VPSQAELDRDPNAAYLHYCTNNTIMGTQFHYVPDAGAVPLFADMSSDIGWKPFDVSKYDLIYAGAQKNIGPAGVTVVIAKKTLIAAGREDIPKIFRFKEHAKENSLLNTVPTFAVYMVRNVLEVVKEAGGLPAMEQRNREKAALLYSLIDEQPNFFRSNVEQASRSVMNPVFRLPNEALDAKMVAEAKEAGFVGIKGHRIVGGIRVSMYNAVTPDQVAQFVDWAKRFARANG
jgi:phosphoserine aminotransferase